MAHRILSEYQRRLQHLNASRIRIENLRVRGGILLRDLNAMYESLFLSAFVGFERFCETSFFEILSGGIRYSRKRTNGQGKAKIVEAVRGGLWEVVHQDRAYVDWMPYERTEKRAAKFLNGGWPFSLVDKDDRKKLDKIIKVRNAIAHSSRHAIGQFQKDVLGSQTLSTSERTPAGFLRGLTTNAPPTTRFEGFVGDLVYIALKIHDQPIR